MESIFGATRLSIAILRTAVFELLARSYSLSRKRRRRVLELGASPDLLAGSDGVGGLVAPSVPSPRACNWSSTRDWGWCETADSPVFLIRLVLFGIDRFLKKCWTIK